MVLLERVRPLTPMFKEGSKASISKRQGTTMEWRIWGGANVGTAGTGLALATTALTEGTPPAATTIAVAKVTKAVQQYGAFVQLTDLAVHQAIDPVWTEAYDNLGEQAGQTLHTLLINDLAAGSNVQYAGAATSRITVTAAMVISGAEIREAVRTLKRAKVPRFPDGYYHGLIHPDATFDLTNDADWKNMNVYAGGVAKGENSMISGELGALHGVKFMESTDAPFFDNAGAGAVDVFGTLIYGPRWFGTVSLEAYKTPSIDPNTNLGMKITGVPVDVETKDDPLGQYGIAGWKTSFAAKILQEFRGVRVEHGATA
jgi:N4-gp56 family major capsid protein